MLSGGTLNYIAMVSWLTCMYCMYHNGLLVMYPIALASIYGMLGVTEASQVLGLFRSHNRKPSSEVLCRNCIPRFLP